LIVDASLTVDWLIGAEASGEMDRLFSSAQLAAPALVRLEVANALRNILARRKMDKAFRDDCLKRFAALPLDLDDAAIRQAGVMDQVVTLSDRHGLTIYDAAYLELAIRTSSPLASFDQPLLAAAGREGVETFTL